VSWVSADKAYGSIKNTNTIADLGGTPFIAFKTVHTDMGTHRRARPGTARGVSSQTHRATPVARTKTIE
jgi:hypothetical protein